MKKYTLIIIAITFGISIVLSIFHWKQWQYNPVQPEEVKEIADILNERNKASEIFWNESNILLVEATLIEKISRITLLKDDYKYIDDIDSVGNESLRICYYLLAYLYKCQDNKSAYNLVYARYVDESPRLPLVMLQGRTMQQFFEYHVLSSASGKKTIWNDIDRQMQNEARERNLREKVEDFIGQLGISITLKGGLTNFRSDIESAIMQAGLENILAKARSIADTRKAWLRVVEERDSIKIEYYTSGNEWKIYVTYIVHIEKDIDGKLISCSFAIVDASEDFYRRFNIDKSKDLANVTSNGDNDTDNVTAKK